MMGKTEEGRTTNPEEIAREWADVHQYSYESEEAAYIGCKQAVERAFRQYGRAEAEGWKPWGTEDLWLNYWDYVYFCTDFILNYGLYEAARRVGTRTVNPEAIAEKLSREPYPSYRKSTYAGCLKGIDQGMALRHEST